MGGVARLFPIKEVLGLVGIGFCGAVGLNVELLGALCLSLFRCLCFFNTEGCSNCQVESVIVSC